MKKLCLFDDVAEGQSKGFIIDGQAYFAVKKDNQFFTYINMCPHLGVPLEWQEDQFLDADGDLIQCSTHGALFIIESGECVSGPCQGDYLTPTKVQVVGDTVYIDTG